MIELTPTQCQDLLQGKAVRVAAAEIATDCVVLRADVYERLRSLLEEEEGMDMRSVALLIERNMREEDKSDPLLQSYQDSEDQP